jgi:hypothetical protein
LSPIAHRVLPSSSAGDEIARVGFHGLKSRVGIVDYEEDMNGRIEMVTLWGHRAIASDSMYVCQ